jgi:hypothetical protein
MDLISAAALGLIETRADDSVAVFIRSETS